MKTITLGSEVYVTDPCYEPDLWCCNKVENVLAGDYIAIMKENNENRVESLTVTHKDYVNQKLEYTLADFVVGVDSGQAGIVDKEYYDKNQSDDYFYNEKVKTFGYEMIPATEQEIELAETIKNYYKRSKPSNDKEEREKNRELLKHINEENMQDWFCIATNHQRRKFINLLATPDNKGAFKRTMYGDGGYPVYLARNKNSEIISIKIDYN